MGAAVETLTEPRTRRHAFGAMGTTVALIAPAHVGDQALDRALRLVAAEFEEQEQRFSRFRTTSELSTVNGSAGHPTSVTEPFAALVRTALDAAARTDGLFDPTVERAMVTAGYDRDFDDVIQAAREVLRPAAPTGRWREIVLRDGTIAMPEGVTLDLGGIAKGWTADRAAARIAALIPWAVIDAGGDLTATGDAPDGGLAIGIEHPIEVATEIMRVWLTSGALATSSIVRRSWGPGLHHLIDPRTGRPATTGVVQATVWAPTCAQAEVRAKEAMLLGEEVLERLPATLVLADGTVVTNMAG